MPEGPELAIAASYINRVCNGKVFSRIQKSEVSKCANIPWIDGDQFSLSAAARGKELMVCMESIPGSSSDSMKQESKSNGEPRKNYVFFHFGMSGRFAFTAASELPKHAHLSFVTADHSEALSFVDTRRFGKWEVKNSSDDWSQERGPCALTEYDKFRENIAKSINDSIFDRPLCEAMLDQRYFNGIGNYLRAEIIYRAGVPPFEKARSILQPIIEKSEVAETKDLLDLCRIVQEEVVALQGSHYTSPDHYLSDNDKAFDKWLQCYGKPTMNQLRDANKRMMWFSGPAGSMAKRAKERADWTMKKRKKETTRVRSNGGATSMDVVKQEEVGPPNGLMTTKSVKQVKQAKRRRSRNGAVIEANGTESNTEVTNEMTDTTMNYDDIGIMTRSRAKILKLK